MFGFAKMKGYCPWPAQKKGQVRGQLWVYFFGSKTFGTISKSKWTDLTSDSYTKIGSKHLKKSGYLKALKEMTEIAKLNETANNIDQDPIVNNAVSDTATGDVEKSLIENNIVNETVNAAVSEDIGVYVSGEALIESASDDVREGFSDAVSDYVDVSEVLRDGVSEGARNGVSEGARDGVSESVSDAVTDSVTDNVTAVIDEVARGLDVGVSDVLVDILNVAKNVPSKRKDQTSIKSAFAKKTLQDSQREVQKNFSEKITKVNDGFSCKFCSKFSTSLELRAKTHSMTCGRKTKKVGPKKKPVCPECKTVFENRNLFRKHYKDQHQNSAYKCSRCLKTYKLRKTYMAHLNSHNEMFLSKFQCDLCDYKGVDTWNLKRHKVRKHNAANWSPEPDSTAEQQLESLNIAYRNRVMTVNDEATEPNNNEIIDDQSIRSADHTDIEENNELEDNNKEADTSAADQNQSDNEIHEHVVPKPKQLSRYEQIRLDIITERDQMLADSGLLDEIHAAKQDLSPPKRVKTKVPNEHSKNLPVRRSGRNCLSDSNCSISKPSESQNISNNSRSDEIKLEIKVELVEATEDSFGDEAEQED